MVSVYFCYSVEEMDVSKSLVLRKSSLLLSPTVEYSHDLMPNVRAPLTSSDIAFFDGVSAVVKKWLKTARGRQHCLLGGES